MLAGRGYARTPAQLLSVLLVVAAFRSPTLFTSGGLTTAISVAAPLILATMALTPVAISGRGGIDLSVGPLIGFLNVTIIVWLVQSGIDSPVAVVSYTLGMALLVGLMNGFLVAGIRLQPVIATLGVYLILTGLALYIMPQPGGTVPGWLASLARDTAGVPNGALVLIGAFAVWTLISRSTFFRHVRLVGGNERAAFASGVPIRRVQAGAYLIGAFFGGIGGLMLTAVIASGNAGQGDTYTLTSVAALALGGVSLAGGQGGMLGAVIGAVDVYLINYLLGTFSFGVNAAYVSQLSYGLVLVFALLLAGLVAHSATRRRSTLDAVR